MNRTSASTKRTRSRIGELSCTRGTLLAALLALAALPSGIAAEAQSQIAIVPLTTAAAQPPSGYFVDPYPVHLASFVGTNGLQFLSGTTKAILACPAVIDSNCQSIAPIAVTTGALEQQAAAAGSKLTTYDNLNIYQDETGALHMAVTYYVTNPKFPNVGNWTVIVHAHPVNPQLPVNWVADTLLVGSFSEPAKANYDGKYFVDGGTTYLVYSKNLSGAPATHDGIVAQQMTSFTQPAASEPTVLLQPDDVNGGFNSEFFYVNHTSNAFKLVETGNITKIDGKYAMAYSTGAFNETDYKTGVAWSDTFLPEPGSNYKRALKLDAAGVWGQPDHYEVQYLLQAQIKGWPNYVAGQVQAPGVPSIVKDGSGVYRLFFAGYAPTVKPQADGSFNGSFRQPYLIDLNIHIPAGATVAGTSNEELTNWITPVTR